MQHLKLGRDIKKVTIEQKQSMLVKRPGLLALIMPKRYMTGRVALYVPTSLTE